MAIFTLHLFISTTAFIARFCLSRACGGGDLCRAPPQYLPFLSCNPLFLSSPKPPSAVKPQNAVFKTSFRRSSNPSRHNTGCRPRIGISHSNCCHLRRQWRCKDTMLAVYKGIDDLSYDRKGATLWGGIKLILCSVAARFGRGYTQAASSDVCIFSPLNITRLS